MSTPLVQDEPLRLSVSLVCYRSDPALLQKTLDSLRMSVAQAGQQFPLTVSLTLIDNGQQQEALRALLQRSGWPQATLLANAGNAGFGKANNQAIRVAGSDFHLVLNPDVELDAAAVAEALRYLQQHSAVVAVSPACRNGRGENESLCKRYPSLRVLLLRGFAPAWLKAWCRAALDRYECVDLLATGQPVAVPLISGCFMLCRTPALQQAGGFDERYFLYFEDFALSLALGRQGQLHHVPACRIVHHGGNAARKGLRHILLFAASAVRFYRQSGWALW